MDVDTSEAIERSLRGEMGTMRAEFRDGLADNRRHSEILHESLEDDIRLLTEGLGSLKDNVRILSGGFAHLSARLDCPRG